jgi:hypothetical protein
MKHGVKPTAAQRKLMAQWKLDCRDWLVVKDTPERMELVHRLFERTRKVIPKGVNKNG